MATPVVLTTGARPITPVESGGVPMTPVDTLGEPVTVVDALGEPVVLINNDGTPAFLAYSAKTYLGGVAPYHWLDFINNRALYAGADVGNVTGATGYSFTRASDGYYTNSDGTLTLFGSGALRRGDRGVLIEGSRTNLLTYSQQFDNASWTKGGGTISANAIAAPDGTMTADLFTEDTSTGIHRAFQTVTLTAAAHTISFFIKPNGRNWIWMYVDGGLATAFVNVATGATGTTFGSPTVRCTLLANSWAFVSLSWTNVTTASQNVQIYTATGDGTTSYTGNGTSGFYLWQADLQAGAFPSSPIVTVAASATRAADSLSYSVALGGTEFALYQEWTRPDVLASNSTASAIFQSAATADNRLSARALGRAGDIVTSGGVEQASPVNAGSDVSAGTIVKYVSRVATNDYRAAQNGSLGTQDTSVTLPVTLDTLGIGKVEGAAIFAFAYIRRIAVINFAPTDAQLQAMTST